MGVVLWELVKNDMVLLPFTYTARIIFNNNCGGVLVRRYCYVFSKVFAENPLQNLLLRDTLHVDVSLDIGVREKEEEEEEDEENEVEKVEEVEKAEEEEEEEEEEVEVEEEGVEEEEEVGEAEAEEVEEGGGDGAGGEGGGDGEVGQTNLRIFPKGTVRGVKSPCRPPCVWGVRPIGSVEGLEVSCVTKYERPDRGLVGGGRFKGFVNHPQVICGEQQGG